MTDPDVRALAWCGNSVYHDACDPGVYDDRCGACRRMFERLSTHHLAAGGTLQTALRQHLDALRVFILQERNMYRLSRYQDDVLTMLANDLSALLPALEPKP